MTCNQVPVPLAPDGPPRRVLRRRAVPGVAAVVGAAPDDPDPRTAHLRRDRHGCRGQPRRRDVPRRASRRPGVRASADQRERGRSPARPALRAARSHIGYRRCGGPARESPTCRPTPTIPAHSTCGGSPTRDRAARLRDDPGAADPAASARSSSRYDEVVGPGRLAAPRVEGHGRGRPSASPREELQARRRRDLAVPRRPRRHLRPARRRRPAVAARPDAARHGRRRAGRGSRWGSRSGRSCSTRCSSTCTASRTLLRDGILPSAHRLRALGVRPPARPRERPRPAARCCCRRPTSAATPRASGTCSPIACRPPRASATRWRTAG